MSNALRWRALLVVAVVAGAAALVFTQPARLGLDLKGGTQIVLEAQDTDRVKIDGDVASRTLEVLRRRVDALGVAEPTLQRSGERRIIVELPGVADPEEAVEVIGRTAQLAFHQVAAVETIAVETTAVEDAACVLTGEGGERSAAGIPPRSPARLSAAPAPRWRATSRPTGTWRSTSAARAVASGPRSPARPHARRRATRSGASPSCSTEM